MLNQFICMGIWEWEHYFSPLQTKIIVLQKPTGTLQNHKQQNNNLLNYQDDLSQMSFSILFFCTGDFSIYDLQYETLFQ